MVDAVLNVAVHEGCQVVDGIVDAMVGDTSLRIVVRADFGRTVTGAHHGLSFGSDVVDVFLVFLVVDESTQTAQGTFLVLRLVAGFRTFDKDFFHDTRVRVLPVVAQTDPRFYLVHVLTSRTSASEGIPFDFTFVDFYIEGFCFGKYGN